MFILQVAFTTKMREYYVSFPPPVNDTWAMFDISWSETAGLIIYINERQVAQSSKFIKRTTTVSMENVDLCVVARAREHRVGKSDACFLKSKFWI